jgi:hypothetical protein
MADELTLTLRLHDPLEKKNPAQSASWAVITVPREDISLTSEEFMAKHIAPHLVHLKQLKLS